MKRNSDGDSRILIIDDNPAIHNDFRKILQPNDETASLRDLEASFFGAPVEPATLLQVELDSAYQGREGLQKLKDALAEGRGYMVAFVDMRMPPGWDGLTTIERLWEIDPDLQVVICTAYSDNSWQDICVRLGRTDRLLILKKPFDNVEVCQLALALTEKWRMTQQARLTLRDLQKMVDERAAQLQEKEEALRQKQKLEAIGSLAGGIAHEFNNLLQAIQGYVSFAREELPIASQPRADLDEAIKATRRASTMTRQLLSFSRRQEVVRRPTDVNEVVSETLRMLRPLLGEQIVVRTESDDAVRAVSADGDMLQQVLMNLCINARDAMEGRGDLSIRTETVELGDRRVDSDESQPGLPPGTYCRLVVSDTGRGMAPDVLEQAFDPFFTTKEVGSGTGLGLAMVHGIVQQHEGDVRVESEVGRGTRFELYLPALDAPPTGTELEPDEPPPPAGRETILIAEDDPHVRAVAQRSLEAAGYKTVVAQNGAEAVAMYDHYREEISVVLLDVIMPELSGHQVLDALQARSPEVRAVFCTGYDPDTASTSDLQSRGCGIIEKPYSRTELLRTVHGVLSDVQEPTTADGESHGHA